jgi:predicted TIM-barrel fold metal-dependent hydrolase
MENDMTTRRQFLRGAASGIVFCGCGLHAAYAQVASARSGGSDASDDPKLNYKHPDFGKKRAPVIIAGRRIKTIDVHAHCFFHETVAMAGPGVSVNGAVKGGPQFYIPSSDTDAVAVRLGNMDAMGIDMEVLSINPFWYGKDRDVAGEIVEINNNKLAELCAAHPKRFAAFASLALQHPDLAVPQLERAMKIPGIRGAAIGGSVAGVDFSDPKFHPVWAKAEALGAVLFIHPQSTPQLAARFKGNGWLSNLVGNPLDTTIALQHLIFEGTLDKFPGLKIIAAHGGGYLPSYAARSDHACFVSPANCNPDITLKKKPTEYLNQLTFDALVFTPEALRHLVAQVGASQITIGTDSPIPWEIRPLDHIMNTPTLSGAQRAAILGDNAAKLLKITDI